MNLTDIVEAHQARQNVEGQQSRTQECMTSWQIFYASAGGSDVHCIIVHPKAGEFSLVETEDGRRVAVVLIRYHECHMRLHQLLKELQTKINEGSSSCSVDRIIDVLERVPYFERQQSWETQQRRAKLLHDQVISSFEALCDKAYLVVCGKLYYDSFASAVEFHKAEDFIQLMQQAPIQLQRPPGRCDGWKDA